MLIHQVVERTFEKQEKKTRIEVVGENAEEIKTVLSQLPKPLWDSVLWMALNLDVVYKVMGKIPCSEEESKKIAHYLFAEKRYNLFFAARFGDFIEDDGETIAQELLKIREDRNSCNIYDDNTLINKHLLHGQILTFIKWSIAAANRNCINKRLMQKKWVRDFYDKQTNERLKKKLGKRLCNMGC